MPQDEELPLSGAQKRVDHRQQQSALGLSALVLLLWAVCALPPVADLWHNSYYRTLDMEERGWVWLSVNSILMAMALTWTLFHIENAPRTVIACLLNVLFWAYIGVVFISQVIRDQLSWIAIFNALVITALFLLCLKATWEGLTGPSPGQHSRDGPATWKRTFRKWVLVIACIQLFVAFVACWPNDLPLTPPNSERESAPWELNSGVIFVMALAVLWAAFLTGGGHVDETKQATCAWCALVFGSYFFFSSFSWAALGLVGYSLTTTIILALDVGALVVAAAV